MLRQHLGSILIALAIVLAALIYASVNRYEITPSRRRGSTEVFDRLKGE